MRVSEVYVWIKNYTQEKLSIKVVDFFGRIFEGSSKLIVWIIVFKDFLIDDLYFFEGSSEP